MEDDLSGFESQFNDEIFDGLDEIIDVSTLEWQEIISLSEEANQKLIQGGQALAPKDQWARDAHSFREACRVQLQRRIGGQNG